MNNIDLLYLHRGLMGKTVALCFYLVLLPGHAQKSPEKMLPIKK
jgi:hypothetical protein